MTLPRFVVVLMCSLWLVTLTGCNDSQDEQLARPDDSSASDQQDVDGGQQQREKTETLPSSPSDVMMAYVEAERINDTRLAYALISSEDQMVQSYEEFNESRKANLSPLALVMSSKTIVEIHREVPDPNDENRLTMDVKVTIPDVSSMFMKTVVGAADPDAAEKNLADAINSDEAFPTTTMIAQHNMVREGGDWRLFLGLKSKAEERAEQEREQAEREKRSKISELSSKAVRVLLNDGSKEEQLALHKEILEIDPDNADALRRSVELESEIKKEAEEKAYIDKVEVLAFEATRIDTYSKKQVPAVRFGVKNTGDQTLSMVRVIVYFMNDQGEPIGEKQFVPVNAASITSRTTPLKPNYSQNMEDGRYYTHPTLGSDWETGSAEAKVVEVSFAETD